MSATDGRLSGAGAAERGERMFLAGDEAVAMVKRSMECARPPSSCCCWPLLLLFECADWTIGADAL